MPASAENRMSRSLVYGLGLLRLFTADEPVRGISELAELMSVSRPTAHRYASTCLELGYLEQAPMRRYRLARRSAEPGVSMLGSLLLTQRARPILQELRLETGRTVSLAVLDGREVVYLLRLCGTERGQYELEKGLGAGSRRAARNTAAGRALLGACSDGELDETRWINQNGLAVDPFPTSCGRGLAISVPAESQRPSAIEITVPPEAMDTAEMVASFGNELGSARASLEAALCDGLAMEDVVGLAN